MLRQKRANLVPQDPEMQQFGPVMRRLTLNEQMFVCALFEGARSVTSAAEGAGYKSESRKGLHVMAHRLMRNPKIVDAMREESQRRTATLAPKAQRALEALIDNPQHPDHFKAVKTARDDASITKAAEKVLKMQIEVSDSEKLRAIVDFAKRRGMDPKAFLGFDPANIIDVTPTAVVYSEEEVVAVINEDDEFLEGL